MCTFASNSFKCCSNMLSKAARYESKRVSVFLKRKFVVDVVVRDECLGQPDDRFRFWLGPCT